MTLVVNSSQFKKTRGWSRMCTCGISQGEVKQDTHSYSTMNVEYEILFIGYLEKPYQDVFTIPNIPFNCYSQLKKKDVPKLFHS